MPCRQLDLSRRARHSVLSLATTSQDEDGNPGRHTDRNEPTQDDSPRITFSEHRFIRNGIWDS